MKRTANIFTAILLLPILLSGCPGTERIREAHLYNLTTGEVAPTQFTDAGRGKGTVAVTLASGEQFKGEYVTVLTEESSWGSIYASVYGRGALTTASGTQRSRSQSSQQYGTAIATGDKGTIIQCEYVMSLRNRAGTGACEDNHKVKYKVMF
jgi:hypothetical protein